MQHWYAVYAQPHKERVVEGLLAGRGLQVYLPMWVPAGKRRPRPPAAEPLFARYLFVRLDPGEIPLSSVNWTHDVTRIVTFAGEPAVVPDPVIEWLRARLASQHGRQTDQRPLQQQDRLRIVDGPLAGLDAVFDQRLSSEDRARVFVHLVGRLVACTVDINSVEPL